MNKDVECPYCGKEQNIVHDDGYGYGEELYNQECSCCGKTFVYETTIVFYYDTYQADCLNDGEHKWELTHTYPAFASQMECKQCGERRSLTDEERVRFNIGTSEEYFSGNK